MQDVFFALKMLVLTTLVVIGLQVRVGSSTLEEHTLNFAKSTQILEPLQKVAEGATLFATDLWKRIRSKD